MSGKTVDICFRLPPYIAEELREVVFHLKKRAPDKKWSQNTIVCEAIRVWIIKAKQQLELGEKEE